MDKLKKTKWSSYPPKNGTEIVRRLILSNSSRGFLTPLLQWCNTKAWMVPADVTNDMCITLTEQQQWQHQCKTGLVGFLQGKLLLNTLDRGFSCNRIKFCTLIWTEVQLLEPKKRLVEISVGKSS